MHAILAWQGAEALTAGNVTNAANDIIAVLTGETDKNNLSAFNLPGGTTIASSFAAGWTIWDSSTGTADEWVLRAPCDGDATQYKYVKLRFFASGTYLGIGHQTMEDWDAGSNTPTNACTEGTVNYNRYPTNSYSNGVTEVMATNRYIMIRASLYGRTWGIPCMEISRTHPCLEVGSGYLPAIQTTIGNPFVATNLTTYYARIPRILDDAGTADLTDQDIRCTNNGLRPSTNVTNEFDQLGLNIAYDNANNPFYGVHLILFERRELIGHVCGDSSVAGVYIAPGGVVSGFEDDTLHTLDTTDDLRCMWHDTENITTHGDIRFFIPAE